MKKLMLVVALAVAIGACSKEEAFEIPTGSDVTVQQRDGVTVAGKLIEVKPDQVVVELADGGGKRTVQRADITSMKAAPKGDAALSSTPATTPAPSPSSADATRDPGPRAPEPKAEPSLDPPVTRVAEAREVTIPAGTVLKMNLATAVGSDTSRVEDSVRATLRSPVSIKGVQALPAGTAVTGHVTDVARSAKVKGRARVAFRFTRLDPPGSGESMSIRTATIAREAAATKKRDAATIGGGAVGGAILGGIMGGGDGAAKGAVIGGAGGTGVVMATRGKEVRLPEGTLLSVRLTAPLTLRVR